MKSLFGPSFLLYADYSFIINEDYCNSKSKFIICQIQELSEDIATRNIKEGLSMSVAPKKQK